MVLDYEVVSEHDLAILKSKVKEMLAAGWQPFENLVVSETMVHYAVVSLYTQVMVKTGEANM
jgi:hypothetical protein